MTSFLPFPRLPFLLLALVGCGAKDDSADDSAVADDTADTGDSADTGEPVDIVYPTAERILLFTGHGGAVPAGAGWGRFEGIATHWSETYGFETDWTDVLASDASDYRLIAFIGQGLDGGSPFDSSTVAKFTDAMALGTRILVVTEVGNCKAPILNQLLTDLGVSIQYTGDGAQEYSIFSSDRILDHQVTTGVSSLQFSDPCFLDAPSAESLVASEEDVLVAAERPGDGGDVVVVGDFEFLDDSGGMKRADNLLFADRIVEIDPAMAK